ncbi:MAG: nickel transporter [Proteobacteria bacterium]|nr:MAG: nickel transporter [Pseudomonadota bacterium]
MLQVDDYLRTKGGKVTVNMPFTHPSHGGPMMDMGQPLSVQVSHKGKTTDLLDKVTPVTWQGTENSAKAFKAEAKLRGLGDYVFTMTPEPYLETSEDAYIQQFTKTIVNVGGLPTTWNEPLNNVAEIVPDQPPYAVYAGGLFSGVVLADGKPVPGAEVEVEFLNYDINKAGDGFTKDPYVEYPVENINIATVVTDDNGRFFFGVPHAGYWGFAALGVGAKKEYKGKELSQDAVLWIQAHQLKKLR